MQVQVTSKEDKRGLTTCVTTTLARIVLALQLIYGGQREKSLPRKEARSKAEAAGFVFSLTKNHWCTLESMQEWIEKVNILNSFVIPPQCRNPSFGLATKAKGLQGCGPKGSPGVTSRTPGSVGKREGVNPHTPKATPALGDGVPVDSRNFRDQFEGSNLNGLWRSLHQWKALEA
jgi:hypothetical protein